jgi:hypothetical protein
MLGYARAVSGDAAGARRVLDGLESEEASGRVHGYAMALIAAGLEDTERVFAELESALTDRDPGLTFLRVEPRWAGYAADARFQHVLERVGLASEAG